MYHHHLMCRGRRDSGRDASGEPHPDA